MKILSWNVNGIRAVERKGELELCVQKYDPDVLLIQEIKAKPDQLASIVKKYPQYTQHYNPAQKPGYAGTAIWVHERVGEHDFEVGMTDFEDDEGRVARIDIGEWTIFGVYFPNGGKSPEAWQEKLEFYAKFLEHINTLRTADRRVIWAGDVNCAHNEIDLARPKENETSIGFLPEERAWLNEVEADNWVDVYRDRNPEGVIYSWWHVITRARERNIGWRIDYFWVDKSDLPHVKDITYLNEQMGSDHCPVLLDMSG